MKSKSGPRGAHRFPSSAATAIPLQRQLVTDIKKINSSCNIAILFQVKNILDAYYLILSKIVCSPYDIQTSAAVEMAIN